MKSIPSNSPLYSFSIRWGMLSFMHNMIPPPCASKACFLLHKRLSKFKNMSVSVIMDLFDKCIGAILNYSCEVWGFHNARDVEQVHLSFCKRVLGVKKTTQIDFVYGELERVPMSIERYIRVLNYWLQIVTGEKSALVYAVYQEGFRSIDDSCKYSWCRSVRTTLFQFEMLGTIKELEMLMRFANVFVKGYTIFTNKDGQADCVIQRELISIEFIKTISV